LRKNPEKGNFSVVSLPEALFKEHGKLQTDYPKKIGTERTVKENRIQKKPKEKL